MKTYGVAVIGCGNIAGAYVDDLKNYPEVQVLGATDLDQARAQAFCDRHGIPVYPSLEAVLADSRVDIICNLTTHFAHHAINTQALEAGKHVFSEKPMAVTAEEAHAQVALAKHKGLRLASAPFTLLGEVQQTAWKLIRDGKVGKVRAVFAEVNWGRIESWHPAPGPFYEVGALFDVGVYPLTILTAMFGPVHRVIAYGKVLYPDRVTKEGIPFHIQTPDFTVVMLETESGAVVRLTSDFYVAGSSSNQRGIEFHGDTGTVYLDDWHNFDGKVYMAPFGEALQLMPPVRTPSPGTPRGRGIQEMALAMNAGRPHRFDGEHAAHVVDVMVAAARSMAEERPVEVKSRFTPPPPQDWAQ